MRVSGSGSSPKDALFGRGHVVDLAQQELDLAALRQISQPVGETAIRTGN